MSISALVPHDTILLVDDEPGIAETLLELLALAGYWTLSASNGVEALQVMEVQTPSLIISDVGMQQMDGFAFLKAVRQNPAWNLIPFIFLTARSEPVDVQLGKSLGVDHYVKKPFEIEHLMLLVQQRLERASQIQADARTDALRMKQQMLPLLAAKLTLALEYIYSYANLLNEEHIRSMSDLDVAHMLAGIGDDTGRLHRMLDDVMLITRIDSGIAAVEVARSAVRTNLHPVLMKTTAGLESQIRSRKLAINTDEVESVEIVCVPSLIDEMVVRVLAYIIQVSSPGSTAIHMSCQLRDDMAQIIIESNGINCDTLDTTKLFVPLEQIDHHEFAQEVTGLELTIARSVARLHGGDLGVERLTDTECAFMIQLPVNNSA